MPQRCSNPACTAAATFTCSRCHAADYCGAPCQRAHWRAHRPGCAAPPAPLGLEAAAHARASGEGEAAALRQEMTLLRDLVLQAQAAARGAVEEAAALRSEVRELQAGSAGLAAEAASAQASAARSGAAAAALGEELAALRREVGALGMAQAQARGSGEGAAPARTALAGGAGGTTLLSSVHLRLLPYFDTREACALRLVCREMRSAVAAHQWQDRATVILGSIGRWRACFPRARCANLRFSPNAAGWRHTPVVDADFVHFVGLWELNMRRCSAVTDAAFVHLRGIRLLDMTHCDQPAITDAGLAHLVGIQKLSIWGCNQATITDAAFGSLRGIRVLNMSQCRQLTDAAYAHLKGIHTLLMGYCDQPTITDAALAHLKGIKCLVLWGCSIPFTEMGLTHLKGITRLHMGGANTASIAAARDLGLPATMGGVTEYTAFRFSDTTSGPWPTGAEWK